jgi:cell division protein ZapA (FtsZ GTPase activity inhibitor)
VLKQITILGRTYNVRADENDDIERAAADVDRRMRAMSGRGSTMDNYTVALLTALNLASEVQSLRRRTRARLEEMEREVAAVEAVLEAAIAEGEGIENGETGPDDA